jgi:hypothetical protein
MVARWGAYAMVWLINGDGDYRGDKADRWKRIGRAVFDGDHAPVSLHPGGMQWNMLEFRDEPWLDIVGYQSGHGDDDKTFSWLVNGPPATDWTTEPARPFINLEAPYEGHIAYQSRRLHDDHSVRRASYWSLLVAPTAGVTYGGHGIWGWDDGSAPPVAHPNTGTPLPWQKALTMPGAEHMRHLHHLFASIAWWKLRPAQHILAAQPGEQGRYRYMVAAQSDEVTLVYLPQNESVSLRAECFPADVSSVWFNPSNGLREVAAMQRDTGVLRFNTPRPGDWVLLLGAALTVSG